MVPQKSVCSLVLRALHRSLQPGTGTDVSYLCAPAPFFRGELSINLPLAQISEATGGMQPLEPGPMLDDATLYRRASFSLLPLRSWLLWSSGLQAPWSRMEGAGKGGIALLSLSHKFLQATTYFITWYESSCFFEPNCLEGAALCCLLPDQRLTQLPTLCLVRESHFGACTAPSTSVALKCLQGKVGAVQQF